MVYPPFRQHCSLCAALAKKIKGKKKYNLGYFPDPKNTPMQSVASGCSCHLPSTARLHSTDTVAVGAVGDGWILPRKHSNSVENIAQISSSCYGVSVHFLRKILLWYSSCNWPVKIIYFFLICITFCLQQMSNFAKWIHAHESHPTLHRVACHGSLRLTSAF